MCSIMQGLNYLGYRIAGIIDEKVSIKYVIYYIVAFIVINKINIS